MSTLPRVDPADIQHLVVLGHPAPRSFNRAVAERYCRAVRDTGQTAVLRDLYSQGFDPLLHDEERTSAAGALPPADIATERHLIERSAVIVFVYPLWLGMPPAIIKGYIDRVFGAGFAAYGVGNGQPDPRLHGKKMVMFSSSGSTRPWLEEKGQWLSLRQAFDSYLAALFEIDTPSHVHFDAVVTDLKPSYFAETQAQVDEQARSTCSEVLRVRHAQQTRTILDHAEFA